MSQAVLAAVWAQSLNGVIGRGGTMPWYAPEDLAHFKNLTLGCPVIMGRKTWDSFPKKFRPLPGRENIVVSTRVQSPTPAAGALWVPSFGTGLEIATGLGSQIWLIGGSMLYSQVLPRTDLPGIAGGAVSRVERTVFASVVYGNAKAPDLGSPWMLESASDYTASAGGWLVPQDGATRQPLEYRFESWRRLPYPG